MQNNLKASTQLISDRNSWRWGFTPQAEIWNGRMAMVGILLATIIEVIAGQ